ncbi:alcohol dehydrogenase Bli-4 [Fusarium tjaetaba]|uniref:Alcohol dehydrogenase Bli-4 n=1 Tax=Fusarium tjaetaba TaxID=1567544 RepID=A0A8H5S243_9HYPO|nr:alcohol dehydrogenase Bli-4 [Fusarium tjaetaba]KAF5642471.1 alcohol dehydrogenase Bli-4 [Fusarium tjaetaba]
MGHGSAFDPDRDIPSLEGKVILITGGNVGLGKQSALALSKHQPSELWIAARSAKKADSAIAEIKQLSPAVQVRFLELDLASFASVKTAAEAFLSPVSRLDILMLNAGIMACPPGQTTEGYEVQFGTNHMGHALLTKILLPLLIRTASSSPRSDVRVVSASSVAHKFGPSGGIQFDTLKSTATAMSTNDRYGQSKLANLLFIRELAEHHPELTVALIHPGTVKTDLQKSNDGSWMINVFQKVVVPLIGVSVEEGAKSQLWAATAKGVQSGEYYVPVGVSGEGSQSSNDKALAKKLWDWTEKELESYI